MEDWRSRPRSLLLRRTWLAALAPTTPAVHIRMANNDRVQRAREQLEAAERAMAMADATWKQTRTRPQKPCDWSSVQPLRQSLEMSTKLAKGSLSNGRPTPGLHSAYAERWHLRHSQMIASAAAVVLPPPPQKTKLNDARAMSMDHVDGLMGLKLPKRPPSYSEPKIIQGNRIAASSPLGVLASNSSRDLGTAKRLGTSGSQPHQRSPSRPTRRVPHGKGRAAAAARSAIIDGPRLSPTVLATRTRPMSWNFILAHPAQRGAVGL